MAKKTTKQAKAKATTNGSKDMAVTVKNGFTSEQVKYVKTLAEEASVLSKKLNSLFEHLDHFQKIRKVRHAVIEPVNAPFTVWKRDYMLDTEARSAERAEVKVERIAKRREKLAERRRKLDEAEAKIANAEKELTSKGVRVAK